LQADFFVSRMTKEPMTNLYRSLPIMNARVTGAIVSCPCGTGAVVKSAAVGHRQDRFMS
jgi:hypothetical protein